MSKTLVEELMEEEKPQQFEKSDTKEPINEKNLMTPEERENVIRDTFEAISAVGFTKWKAEELAIGNKLTEDDRGAYFASFKEERFDEFRKMATRTSDAQLLQIRDAWIEMADAMGLKEWQEALSAKRGTNSREEWSDVPGLLIDLMRGPVIGWPETFQTNAPLSEQERFALRDQNRKQSESVVSPDGDAVFDARLNDYRIPKWNYEDTDERGGEICEWHELSPEGKLSYLARDAVSSGASSGRFFEAAREFLGDLPAEAREEAALSLVLQQKRELHSVEQVLSSVVVEREACASSPPLSEQLQHILDILTTDSELTND